MFEIGQYVVKANTGVCKVTEIRSVSMSEEDEAREYYILSPYGDSRSTILVPVGSDKSNVRSIMTEEEAGTFIHQIPEIEVAWIESDRQREQHYKDAIKSNRPDQLVSIIKNLYIRSRERELQGKKTTAVDDRYVKIAEAALYQELAIALGKLPEDMRSVVMDTLEPIG